MEKLKKELKNLYMEMLNDEEISSQIKEKNLTLMFCQKGDKFEGSNCKLMYVGRALNGWYSLDNDNIEEMYDSAIENIRKNTIKNMDGIRRSAFWQLCKAILTKEKDSDGNWDSDWDEKIVWSNLLKIAPCEGGNPDWNIIANTIKKSFEILKAEIEILEPKYVVLVVGKWIEFEGQTLMNDFGIEEIKDTFVIGKGTYKNSTIIVTQRPEMRSGTREEQADEIIRAF